MPSTNYSVVLYPVKLKQNIDAEQFTEWDLKVPVLNECSVLELYFDQ